MSLLVEMNGLLGAAFDGKTRFLVPFLGHLGKERHATTLVVGVYCVRGLGVATPVAHTRFQVDLQAHVTMLTGLDIRV
jgi:hypothetical protein